MNAVLEVKTTTDFADYIMDELGRWIALDCPVVFESRKFRTGLFSFLYEGEIRHSPINIKFTNNGYVVFQVNSPNDANVFASKVARFEMANPSLRENMISCFDKLENQDFSDFASYKQANEQWKKFQR